MGIRSWLGKLLATETHDGHPISVYKLETPDKIIETKIQPVKVPSIVDVGERLALIVRDIAHIKDEMVSKAWFNQEFMDTTPKIMDLLSEINQNLLKLLSNFTKNDKAVQTGNLVHFEASPINPEYLFKIIKTHDKIRYKDIKSKVPISDPTLSKYLKNLISDNKVRRVKVGKAVFYISI